MTTPRPRQSFVQSVRIAFEGLFLLCRDRNIRIQIALSLVVIALGIVFHLDRWEWVAAIGACAMVLVAEAVNTVVEATVDLACPTIHPQAKLAKDLGAGMVLLACVSAGIVGCFVFIPRLISLGTR